MRGYTVQKQVVQSQQSFLLTQHRLLFKPIMLY